ncbi:DUF6191 domain-containing protein [Streptomyces sp. NBC_01186]|uniref:DUF6191 domain-containing protein n=1 Tax=Streptomyces sp. NBC_01186 TaxID=2903765 RepID=UPI003FA7DA2B
MLQLLTSPLVVLVLVVPLFVLAALRKAAQLAQRRGWFPGRFRDPDPGARARARGVGATAVEELHALIYPSKRVQLEEQRIELVLREDEEDGAPERTGIDLDAGRARFYRTRPGR